jgi:hypothetical protein
MLLCGFIIVRDWSAELPTLPYERTTFPERLITGSPLSLPPSKIPVSTLVPDMKSAVTYGPLTQDAVSSLERFKIWKCVLMDISTYHPNFHWEFIFLIFNFC